jgi:hypothetical protein
MKKLVLLTIAYFGSMLAVVLVTAPARADTSACYTISDADARTACLARARRDASMCYSVQRSDLRALCLAEVRK